jgi:hypothetical protein
MEENRGSRFIDPASGLQILTLVDGACRHPRWFTLHGTFAEVAAFLNGYYFALEGLGGEKGRELVAEWRGFCLWLAEKLEVAPPRPLGRSPTRHLVL